jgi:hypothetical protein
MRDRLFDVSIGQLGRLRLDGGQGLTRVARMLSCAAWHPALAKVRERCAAQWSIIHRCVIHRLGGHVLNRFERNAVLGANAVYAVHSTSPHSTSASRHLAQQAALRCAVLIRRQRD